MSDSHTTMSYEQDLDGQGLRIGIVLSRFNPEVCEGLLDSCLDELSRLGVADQDITLVRVPGALEIPLALQTLAAGEAVDALIALGAVIRGETYHFEIVSNESCRGIMQVQLAGSLPIANGVLTTEDEEQAFARLDKGADCARTAVEMANLMQAMTE